MKSADFVICDQCKHEVCIAWTEECEKCGKILCSAVCKYNHDCAPEKKACTCGGETCGSPCVDWCDRMRK